MDRPIIGIPLGDIAGVGPEIVVKALGKKEIYDKAKPLVIGEMGAVKRALEITELSLDIEEAIKLAAMYAPIYMDNKI